MSATLASAQSTHLAPLAAELLPRRQPDRATVIAFTSIRSGAGVSYITALAAEELARRHKLDTLALTIQQAMRLPLQPDESTVDTFRETQSHVWTLVEDALEPQAAPISPEMRIRELQNWPGAFILLDCPALTNPLAPEFLSFADGVVMVVEAGQTSKADLARAAALLSQAGATVVGMVLNKRTYAIPRSLRPYA